MIKLKIDRIGNEYAETKKELGNRSCSELATAADDGIGGAVVNEHITCSELYTRHQGLAERQLQSLGDDNLTHRDVS